MKPFRATLNLTFDARDEQEAIEIAQAAAKLLMDPHNFEFKVQVEADDVEEN